MRFAIPPEYSDRTVVPEEYLGPLGIPTLGWLANEAAFITLVAEDEHILKGSAAGLKIPDIAAFLKANYGTTFSHDAIERRRDKISSDLLATCILHAGRIAIEAGIVPVDHPKPGQIIPDVLPQNVETLDLLSRGYTPAQVAKLQGIQPPTVHSRTKPIYRALEVNDITLATIRAYPAGLLHHLTPRQRLPADDPVLAPFLH